MPGNREAAERLGARGAVARLAAVIFALALIMFLIFALIRGGAGCVSFMHNAEYIDADEAARLNIPEPSAPARVFTDSAYDAVYPDLIEYSAATRSEPNE